jgi:hypothetical protein
MFGFLLFPLLLLSLLTGAIGGAVWYFSRDKGSRPSLVKVMAIPLGCTAIPVGGLILLVIVGYLLQKSDEALAEEVFGYPTTLTDDQMLFDDFGSGQEREIYMRAEMTEAERARLLPISDAVKSEYALAALEARGAARGFMWWVSSDPNDHNFCRSVRIHDAHGFNGWKEFRFAECLDAGTEFPQATNKGKVYVIAAYPAN